MKLFPSCQKNLSAGLQYSAQGKTGKAFKVSPQQLATIGLPIEDQEMVKLNEVNVKEFVVVTGGGRNFFGGLYNAILSIQKFLPNHTVIVYDLGLTKDNKRQVRSLKKKKSV